MRALETGEKEKVSSSEQSLARDRVTLHRTKREGRNGVSRDESSRRRRGPTKQEGRGKPEREHHDGSDRGARPRPSRRTRIVSSAPPALAIRFCLLFRPHDVHGGVPLCSSCESLSSSCRQSHRSVRLAHKTPPAPGCRRRTHGEPSAKQRILNRGEGDRKEGGGLRAPSRAIAAGIDVDEGTVRGSRRVDADAADELGMLRLDRLGGGG